MQSNEWLVRAQFDQCCNVHEGLQLRSISKSKCEGGSTFLELRYS